MVPRVRFREKEEEEKEALGRRRLWGGGLAAGGGRGGGLRSGVLCKTAVTYRFSDFFGVSSLRVFFGLFEYSCIPSSSTHTSLDYLRDVIYLKTRWRQTHLASLCRMASLGGLSDSIGVHCLPGPLLEIGDSTGHSLAVIGYAQPLFFFLLRLWASWLATQYHDVVTTLKLLLLLRVLFWAARRHSLKTEEAPSGRRLWTNCSITCQS
jgi:hypothetical protein